MVEPDRCLDPDEYSDFEDNSLSSSEDTTLPFQLPTVSYGEVHVNRDSSDVHVGPVVHNYIVVPKEADSRSLSALIEAISTAGTSFKAITGPTPSLSGGQEENFGGNHGPIVQSQEGIVTEPTTRGETAIESLQVSAHPEDEEVICITEHGAAEDEKVEILEGSVKRPIQKGLPTDELQSLHIEEVVQHEVTNSPQIGDQESHHGEQPSFTSGGKLTEPSEPGTSSEMSVETLFAPINTNHVQMLECLLLAGADSQNTLLLDDLMEDLLNACRKQLNSYERLKDVNEDINWTLFRRVKVKGHFVATEATLGDLKTLCRTGGIAASTVDDRLRLETSLGLGTLCLVMDRYEFKLMNTVLFEGSLKVVCKENSVTAVIDLVSASDKYSLVLNKIQINFLKGFEVEMSDPRGKGENGAQIIAWILNHFDVVIRVALNDLLTTALTRVFKKINKNQLNKLKKH